MALQLVLIGDNTLDSSVLCPICDWETTTGDGGAEDEGCTGDESRVLSGMLKIIVVLVSRLNTVPGNSISSSVDCAN